MLATVSARVPVEVRNQVHQKLSRSGSTPSEFINEVYSKFLDNELHFDKGHTNALSTSENNKFVDMLKLSTCNFENPLPASFDFEAELEEGRRLDYEALA